MILEWCDEKIKEAAEEGNYEEWQNYTRLKTEWERKLLTPEQMTLRARLVKHNVENGVRENVDGDEDGCAGGACKI